MTATTELVESTHVSVRVRADGSYRTSTRPMSLLDGLQAATGAGSDELTQADSGDKIRVVAQSGRPDERTVGVLHQRTTCAAHGVAGEVATRWTGLVHLSPHDLECALVLENLSTVSIDARPIDPRDVSWHAEEGLGRERTQIEWALDGAERATLQVRHNDGPWLTVGRARLGQPLVAAPASLGPGGPTEVRFVVQRGLRSSAINLGTVDVIGTTCQLHSGVEALDGQYVQRSGPIVVANPIVIWAFVEGPIGNGLDASDVRWASNRDGVIGGGERDTVWLNDGPHILQATLGDLQAHPVSVVVDLGPRGRERGPTPNGRASDLGVRG